jgi:hypothetical protein
MSSSGGGGHILQIATQMALSDPLVHGSLPATMLASVDAVLAKEPADWTSQDKSVIANAVSWAIQNIP